MILGSNLFVFLTVILVVGAITLACQLRSLPYKKKSAEALCGYLNDSQVSDENKDFACKVFRVFTSYTVLVLYPLAMAIIIKELFTGRKYYPSVNLNKTKDYRIFHSYLWLFVLARHPIGSLISFVVTVSLIIVYFALMFISTLVGSFIFGKALIKTDVDGGLSELSESRLFQGVRL